MFSQNFGDCRVGVRRMLSLILKHGNQPLGVVKGDVPTPNVQMVRFLHARVKWALTYACSCKSEVGRSVTEWR